MPCSFVRWADELLLYDSPCLDDIEGSELDQLSFYEVYGLWVIIGASIVLGFLFLVGIRYYNRRLDPEWGIDREGSDDDGAQELKRGYSRNNREGEQHLYKVDSFLRE